MQEVDIFSSAKPQSGEFFSFKTVGDSVQGTYIDVRQGIDGYGNSQSIYVLSDADGKIWNVAFRNVPKPGNDFMNDQMKAIRFGQIIGFRYDEERDSKNRPGSKAKIIRIYADPKLVDHAWIEQRKSIEERYSGTATHAATSINTAPRSSVDDEYDAMGGDFEAPAGAGPAAGNLPTGEVAKPQNEAVNAIRNLAKTKGLTTDAMSEEEADKVIEEYTKLPLVEEHLTKIIISLTGYSK